MKKVLVSGSIAYDYIMKFDGIFKNALLKKNLGNLNVSFTGNDKKMFYGGCGPNISYNFALFNDHKTKALLFGVAGKDFKEYADKLSKDGVNIDLVGIDKSGFTASAYILTDKCENQLTIFSPGAMENINAEKNLTDKILKSLSYAILSPDICERTLRLARKLTSARVPWFFDPGQMSHVFKLNDLKFLTANCYGLIANSYEIELLCSKLKISKKLLVSKVKVMIETLGEKGLDVYQKGFGKLHLESVKPLKIVDPTGCGDALRGGLLFGLAKGLGIEDSCRIGALCATFKIEKSGTQNHKFSINEFRMRCKKAFKKKCSI